MRTNWAARPWTRKTVTGANVGSPFASRENEPISPWLTFAASTSRPTAARLPFDDAIASRSRSEDCAA